MLFSIHVARSKYAYWTKLHAWATYRTHVRALDAAGWGAWRDVSLAAAHVGDMVGAKGSGGN